MKIFTVVGARPQFIKASPVCSALRVAGHTEFLVHTGQHYDYAMSQIFFDELGMPTPDYNLGVGSGTHGYQTGHMLMALEELIQQQQPDWVLVYGDTNSTLAGALAAVKLHVPIAHVESGIRSFNRMMPEENNRILTDHIASLLLCPTLTAVENLRREGIVDNVNLVGDTMYDAVVRYGQLAQQRSTILADLNLSPKEYLLTTIHRPYNTDEPANLRNIITALRNTNETVVFPVHPRTRARLDDLGLPNGRGKWGNLLITDPLGYLDMLMLEQHARIIITDSGGIQKEAYIFCVPCITLRLDTEWVETVATGWNVLAGADQKQILAAISKFEEVPELHPKFFGNGYASQEIVNQLAQHTKSPILSSHSR